MPKIKTILFDCSGTLINDINAVWQANSDVYFSLGLPRIATLEEFKRLFKMPIADFHRDNGATPELLQEAEKRFRQFYPRYTREVVIFPEVKEALQRLKESGKRLGVTSNIPTRFLHDHLAQFGIDVFFDTVSGQEVCDEQKPSPKPLLVTLEKIGAKPEEAMYVGDMEEDMIAGKSAGVATAAIVRRESYHPEWRLTRQKPDFLITDLNRLLELIK